MAQNHVGIFAHVDAGKTTLTEQILTVSGVLRQAGSVDAGTTQTDSLEIERRRGISVQAAGAGFSFEGTRFVLIDTPGHADFLGEVQRCLAVLDAAVLVISAADGVNTQVKVLYQAFLETHTPVLVFLNKIDLAGSNSAQVLSQLRELCSHVVPLTLPVEEGSRGCGIVPASAEDAAYVLADFSPDIEQSLLEGKIPLWEEIAPVLREQLAQGNALPILCGSAALGIGVRELLQALAGLLQAGVGEPLGPVSGYVFQVRHSPAMGKAAHVRLYSGTLHNRDTVEICPDGSMQGNIGGSDEPVREKISQIRTLAGTKLQDTGELRAGEHGILYGLASVKTGDSLGTPPPWKIPQLAVPLLRVQVSPDQPGKLPELKAALEELSEEDPLLGLEWVPQARQLTLKLTGAIQLEVLEALLLERYGLAAEFSPPTVIYRETPSQAGIGFAAYTMPKPCWAVVKLEVSPLPRGSGIQFESCANKTKLFPQYQNHVRASVAETLRQGLSGWEVTDILVRLVDGEHHLVHTHPLDFFVATPMAVMDALTHTGTTLLEPIWLCTITAPSDSASRLLGEILHRRGTFDSPVISGDTLTMQAQLPVADALDFPIRLAAMTSGRAALSARFDGYRECPPGFEAVTPRRGVDPRDRAKWILSARNAL